MQNKLRIIGGHWRSRNIEFVDAPGLRPTPSRVRETLFNWLQYDIVGSRCLDLYSGSGALGFEAASRGAKSVLQVENNLEAFQKLQENIRLLSASQMTAVHNDVLKFLKGSPVPFDIVFLDPPFQQNLVTATCQLLGQHGWLNTGAKVYVETERLLKLEGLPSNWQQLKHKMAGDVSYYLFHILG